MGLNGSPGSTREHREFASELKFLVAPDKVPAVRAWARAHLNADVHGAGDDGDTYRISSLYFDTDNFDVFRGNGSFGRSKYRVRRYNDDDVVFLERKTKTKSRVSKRRSQVGINLLPLLDGPEPDNRWSGFWFHRRLLVRRLNPVCQISYVRTARVGVAEGWPIRLTLDRELRARAISTRNFDGSGAHAPLAANGWILELKFRHALPALFKQLITELAPQPQRISKYRLAINALGIAGIASSPAASKTTAAYVVADA